MSDLAMMAASAVSLLTPFLKKAAEKGFEKLGESTAGTLFERLKGKLITPAGQESLSDLAKSPDDPDSQAALRKEIRKAAEQDLELASLLQDLLSRAGAAGGSATQVVTGNENKAAQVQGSTDVSINIS